VIENLTRRLGEVLQERSDVRYALLFGSAVTRGPENARDLDVAVSFTSPLSLMDLGRLAADLEAAVAREVDLIDVDEATTLLRWEIVRANTPIFVRDRDAWLELLTRVPIERADLEPYFERESRGLRRALRG